MLWPTLTNVSTHCYELFTRSASKVNFSFSNKSNTVDPPNLKKTNFITSFDFLTFSYGDNGDPTIMAPTATKTTVPNADV